MTSNSPKKSAYIIHFLSTLSRTPRAWGWILLLCILPGFAQPKWAKKARSAIFSVITYDQEDNILHSGNGFFIHESGEAVADYGLFKGASRAIVVTTDGKQFPVTHIMGADEMYDIIKFRVQPGKERVTALSIDTTGVGVDTPVWLLPYSTSKENTAVSGKVEERTSAASKYHYYTLRLPVTDKLTSCPIANEAGQVVAMVQRPYNQDQGPTSYAIDAHFAASLSIGALTANNRALQAIGIKKALPPTEKEALVYLYMKNKNDYPEEYLDLLGDFITTYPQNAEGYQLRATFYTEKYRDSIHFALAEQDITKAIGISENKADAHFAYCRMIYSNAANKSPVRYKDWDTSKALDQIRLAIAIDSVPLYLQTEGELLFAMHKYPEAYLSYQAVNRTNMATADTYFAAAKALQLTGDTAQATLDNVVRLITAAINTYAPPYPQETAPYIWERAKALMTAGDPRKAVLDYNEYLQLTGGKANALFYYQRGQAAIAARMNQLAVDDIRQALALAPDNLDYLVAHASLMARFNQIDEAIPSCLRAIELAPEYADCHRILGVCYIQKGETEKACQCFHKAQSLGDELADTLILKYCGKESE